MRSLARVRPTLRLHPDNPRYFLFRGKPTVVITSGEHYGAVLNLDFDYRRYFDALKADGLNGTRIFSGTYVETGGNFGIAANTLDPATGRFISPWARSTTDGYADGGAKFDLTKFDDGLRRAAARRRSRRPRQRGIIVELVLFCPLYEDSMWAVSPMNPANNVNGLGGDPPRGRAHARQERAAARRAGRGGAPARRGGRPASTTSISRSATSRTRRSVPEDWQRHMTTVVGGRRGEAAAAASCSRRTSPTRASGSSIRTRRSRSSTSTTPRRPTRSRGTRTSAGRSATTRPASAAPPTWPTAREGVGLHARRRGLYNNLDYSFTVGHEDGTFAFPTTQPGGGGVSLRRQLGVLRRFMDRFDLLKVRPKRELVVGGVPAGGSVQVLAQGDDAYGIYLRRLTPAAGQAFGSSRPPRTDAPVSASPTLDITLPSGKWAGSSDRSRDRRGDRHPDPPARRRPMALTPPAWKDDLALDLRRFVTP